MDSRDQRKPGFSPTKHSLDRRLEWLVEELSCPLEQAPMVFKGLSQPERRSLGARARERFPPKNWNRRRVEDPTARNVQVWLEFAPPVGATELELKEWAALTELTHRGCMIEKSVRSQFKKPVGRRLEPLLRVAWAAASYPGHVYNVTATGTVQQRPLFKTRRKKFLEVLQDGDASGDLATYLHDGGLLRRELADSEFLAKDEIQFLEQMRGCVAQLALMEELARLPSVEEAVSGSWSPSRPAQAKFREGLLSFYDSTCALTGSTIPTALEAAHVLPYREVRRCEVTNGILLRADLHRLFDAHDLILEPVGSHLRVHLAQDVAEVPVYASLAGQVVPTPGLLDERAMQWLGDRYANRQRTDRRW